MIILHLTLVFHNQLDYDTVIGDVVVDLHCDLFYGRWWLALEYLSLGMSSLLGIDRVFNLICHELSLEIFYQKKSIVEFLLTFTPVVSSAPEPTISPQALLRILLVYSATKKSRRVLAD